ncbi:helix-turn-helix transcriptional regulator [Streptomyces sp. NPDC086554]|uniref:helix-turn-helix domain-containing protein n=1 Tax=Streptomyces sp. NPDC086554 TaxID=3154864 RepID=UPI00342CDE15
MATRPIEIGPAGIQTACNIERQRLVRGLSQRQLAERCAALGRPMTNTTLSRTERARRRCDVDDLVAIAASLGVPPTALLPQWTSHSVASHFAAQALTRIQGVLHG